jgi:transcriptional regulator with XRE-family HTH domain
MDGCISSLSKEGRVSLKEFIENYIKQHSLTIREFSRHCGLSHPVILNVLNNPEYRPEISTLEKIANYTGAKLVSLLKMAYPSAFEEDESLPVDDLLTKAFHDAPEQVQDVILKIVGLK